MRRSRAIVESYVIDEEVRDTKRMARSEHPTNLDGMTPTVRVDAQVDAPLCVPNLVAIRVTVGGGVDLRAIDANRKYIGGAAGSARGNLQPERQCRRPGKDGHLLVDEGGLG